MTNNNKILYKLTGANKKKAYTNNELLEMLIKQQSNQSGVVILPGMVTLDDDASAQEITDKVNEIIEKFKGES